ncbi:MAG: membrane-bound PQQ-dependent dehydrogenase, glucose/quinate/shikimate family [Pseudomonadota bacterium]|nr:membrane-bound PQQ-dependent dehydrogenase, glucose/quinate/shikimate family [Pseudomonadota bacterium]
MITSRNAEIDLERDAATPFGGRRNIFTSVLGGALVLFGAVLLFGGIWLALTGGSLYYVLTGGAIVVSGVLIFRRNRLGAWLYAAIFALTIPWALWETGPDPWALVPRLVAHAVLLALVALVTPFLIRRTTWPLALGGAASSIVVLAVVLFGAAISGPDPVRGSYPDKSLAGLEQATGSDWPAWGGTYEGRRFSRLDQITPDNVGGLQRVWVAHTGDLPSGAGKGKYAPETTPLKIGDRLYLCSAMNILIALNARTGQELWRFDPKVSARWIPYSATCRGVAAYRKAAPAAVDSKPNSGSEGIQGVPSQGVAAVAGNETTCSLRIIEGTLDGRLIAVDAASGRPCADFGVNGQVDIKQGMGQVYPGMVSITAPPVIVRGVVITGQQVLDGQTNSAPSGVIQAFDAVTGARRWAWDLGRPGETGWPDPGNEFTRGTPNMWTTASADEALGLVYLPMGNSAVDYYSADRSPQENEFSSALVALDATTGRPVWRFQTVHKDVWDYDLGSQASLVDLPDATPAIVLSSKQGEIYILDRRTGRPLHPVAERPVPQGGVEPEERSATQPFSGFATLRKPNLGERDMWGMSPIDQMVCRIQYQQAAYDGYYTPPTADRHWIQYPGYNGGSDWGSIAIDAARGVIYANYNDMPNYNRLVPREAANRKGWEPRGPDGNTGKGGAEGEGSAQAGTPYAIAVNAGWRLPLTKLLCKEPPYGGIRAISLATGETIWDRPFGTARANGPWGLALGIPFTIGTPNNGGAVVTAGGLIFIAAASDNLVRAIDAETGETLWTDVLPGGGQANVMTYQVDGRQYVVVMAGGHHFMETPISDALVAYALPK